MQLAKSTISKALAAATLSLALVPVASPALADWPMFLKNEKHLTFVEKAPVPPLSLKWRARTDGAVYSSPVAYKGKVFAGSYGTHFYAINADSGEVAWKFKTGGEIFSSPAVSDGAVYFGSRDGFVYALDAETGKLLWKHETEGPVVTSPVVAEGRVLIGSKDLYLYALNAKTGAREWRNKLPDYEKYSGIYSSPAYADGAVFYAGKNGILYSASVKSGGRNWAVRFESAVYSSPVIKDGTLYISSYNRTLYSIDAKTGKIQWRKNLGNNLAYATPSVTSDKLYMGFKSGHLKVFNRKDGTETADYKFPDEINSTAAIGANGFIYVGCDDGGLYAVDTKSGAVAWKYMTEGSLQSSPAVLDKAVYIGSEDGSIYAFEAR